jgi:hypothetical protein
MDFYVEPPTHEAITFPFHRCNFGLGYSGSNTVTYTQRFEFRPQQSQSSGSFVVPHPLTVSFSGTWGELPQGTSRDLVAHFELAVVGAEKKKELSIPLVVVSESSETTVWQLDLSRWRG